MLDIPVSVISGSISRGTVLLSAFEGIDHLKMFVVMGVSRDKICGFSFINSRVHPVILKDKALLEVQFMLSPSDYDFLHHESFLCASTIQEVLLDTLSARIASNHVRIIGHLKEEHIAHILAVVQKSKAISRRHKRLFFQ